MDKADAEYAKIKKFTKAEGRRQLRILKRKVEISSKGEVCFIYAITLSIQDVSKSNGEEIRISNI